MSSTSFEKLHKSLLKFLLATTLEEVYKAVVEEVIYSVGLSYGSIYIFDEAQELDLVYTTLPQEVKVILRKNGYILPKTPYESPRLISRKSFLVIHPETRKIHFQSVLLIPLLYKHESLGVIVVYMMEKRKIDPTQKKSMELFGSMASLAIRNVKSSIEMQRALVLRDEFISLAAHELRTPLTSINGYIQLLQKHLNGSKNQQKDWVDELYGQTHRLIYLVNELLELTRISANRQKFIMKPMHFTPIVQRVVDRYQGLDKTRKINFSNSLPADKDMMIGDAEKLDQLIAHLLDNAEKFSPDNESIIISLEKKGKEIVCKISNKGSLISEDEKKLLFDRFYKGKDSYATGMGLGLFLAKSIADYHKSSLDIETSKKKNTITLTIPRE